HDAAKGVDRADAGSATAQGRAAGVFDVRDVGRHLRPNRLSRRAHYPTADFVQDLRILAHGRAHLAFGQTVRAGEIALEGIDARGLATLDDFDPRILAILLHDGRDEHPVGKLVLA